MRHAGTRLCAQQLAISPTTYCGTCGTCGITDQSYFSGRAAGAEIACVGSIPSRREAANLRFLLFVTATFLLGMYFLPAAVVLSGGVKQVTTLPWHFTPQGAFYGPIYGIYVG